MANPNTKKIEDAAKAEFRTIRALAVKSVAKGFRRLGMSFSREAVHLDPTLLTDEQLQTLRDEPGLQISGAEITVAAADGKPTTPVVVPVAADVAAAAAGAGE